MERSDSHFLTGRLKVFSDFDKILYILERIFWGEDMFINSKMGGERPRFAVWILIFAWIVEVSCRYSRNCLLSMPCFWAKYSNEAILLP